LYYLTIGRVKLIGAFISYGHPYPFLPHELNELMSKRTTQLLARILTILFFIFYGGLLQEYKRNEFLEYYSQT